MTAPGGLQALLPILSRDGKDFERLTKWFLENDPVWASLLDRVWLWDDWPGRWGRDRGIDLVARRRGDRALVAVQAKNYGATTTITKSDLDTFLSESSSPGFAERLLIGTTDRLAAGAKNVIALQEKPVTTALLRDLELSAVRWPTSPDDLSPAVPTRKRPRPHQEAALAAIERWAASDAPRGQIIMACGTGKSLVAIWAAERLRASKILVLVPTLALLRQTAAEWAAQTSVERRLLLVCSDLGSTQQEPDVNATGGPGYLRSTTPSDIRAILEGSEPALVISTYASSPEIAKAMDGSDVELDLVLADEAHRCAGAESSSHKTILDNQKIPARRRLFLTATPTVFGARDRGRAAAKNVALASMDDAARFGPVVFHLPLGDATQMGLLCPYQVVVIPILEREVHELIADKRIVTPDGDQHLSAESLAIQVACARAMRAYDCRRMVAFQATISRSKQFERQFPAAAALLTQGDEPDTGWWVSHVDGDTMRPSQRSRILERFAADDDAYDERRLLSNVRLLAEGVDVPSIDAIAFIDTQRGQQAVIQAVGRVMRPAPGKQVGTILLPVIMRDDETFEAAVRRSEHRAIVNVLGALRSHDREILRSLDELRFSYADASAARGLAGRFVIDAAIDVDEGFADAVGVALAEALNSRAPSRARDSHVRERYARRAAEAKQQQWFSDGLDTLQRLLPWLPVARCPTRVSGVSLDEAWWPTVKQRWREGDLDDPTKQLIADRISWMAPDLVFDRIMRDEMAALTRHGTIAQVVAQCDADGIHPYRGLELCAADYEGRDLVSAAVAQLHRAVTHAAAPADERYRALRTHLPALERCIAKKDMRGGTLEYGGFARSAASIEGFWETIADVDRSTPSDPTGERSWRAHQEPEAYERGALIARRRILPIVQGLAPYKSSGDQSSVQWLRADEARLPRSARLDKLGWEIFLLSIARGDLPTSAARDARSPLRDRKRLKHDLLKRYELWPGRQATSFPLHPHGDPVGEVRASS